ncbi:hypothetical protein PRIPAC_80178 [Pristionchus pacificus]|uniref:G protein-coupled receptor n=1 Tax=Pristionchus pacificus TaxID=54126 RepID=A0A2A6CQ75_PRIPA|nr:hypothetical protein PRIPAC_80178 [Pristionchus pacificus]|eukprot:PDM80181.1 G protein-coupled receptor [Pristionchus pacificus]
MNRIALALLLIAGTASADVYGIDTVAGISSSGFNCLANSGYWFYIGRVGQSNGGIDNGGIQNIKNAWAGGMGAVDAYIFPCHASSCGSAKTQVANTINALRNSGAKFGMLWLDIEIYNWPSDMNGNRQFILDMVAQAQAMGVSVSFRLEERRQFGALSLAPSPFILLEEMRTCKRAHIYYDQIGIYSNNWNWENIVGTSWNGVAQYPLWWANYNYDPGFGAFQPFGGWSKPTIHQRNGWEDPRLMIILAIFDIVIICALILALTLGTLTYAAIGKSQTFSPCKKHFQLTMLVALTAQTIVPFIFVYTPYLFCINFPYFRISVGILAELSSFLTSCFPAWDAVIVILLFAVMRCGRWCGGRVQRRRRTPPNRPHNCSR